MLPQTVHKLSCGTGTSPQAPRRGLLKRALHPGFRARCVLGKLFSFYQSLSGVYQFLVTCWSHVFERFCIDEGVSFEILAWVASISVYENTVRIPPNIPNIYRCNIGAPKSMTVKAGPKCRTPFLACGQMSWMLYVRRGIIEAIFAKLKLMWGYCEDVPNRDWYPNIPQHFVWLSVNFLHLASRWSSLACLA